MEKNTKHDSMQMKLIIHRWLSLLMEFFKLYIFYAFISEMKFNINKIRTGSRTISTEVFHHSRWKFKLKIVDTNFYLLVMKFLINLDDMINVNYKYATE